MLPKPGGFLGARSLVVNDKNVKNIGSRRIFRVDQEKLSRRRLAVAGGMGVVELELDASIPWDSFRQIEIGSDLWIGEGTTLETRHSLLVFGWIEVRGELVVRHTLFIRGGGYANGNLKAGKIVSLDDLIAYRDLTVDGPIICDGLLECQGKLSVKGPIEAYVDAEG